IARADAGSCERCKLPAGVSVIDVVSRLGLNERKQRIVLTDAPGIGPQASNGKRRRHRVPRPALARLAVEAPDGDAVGLHAPARPHQEPLMRRARHYAPRDRARTLGARFSNCSILVNTSSSWSLRPAKIASRSSLP